MGRNSEYALKAPSRDPSYKRMQGNFPAKKYKKGTPTMTRLSFEGQGSGTMYIDIAQALSIMNRRSYRQGCYYYVNSVEFYDDEQNTVNVLTAPDTWMTKASHRRGVGIWNEMNEQVLRMGAGTILPKYHDFKVYLTDGHRTTGTTGPSLYGVNDDQAPAITGEWAYSEYTSADTNQDGSADADEFKILLTGRHVVESGSSTSTRLSAVSLIESYQDTRALVNQAPALLGGGAAAITSGDPLLNIHDGGVEEHINDLVINLNDQNDTVPYDRNQMVGAAAQYNLQHVARLSTAGSTGRTVAAAGFCAPCGLVMVDPIDTGYSGGSSNRWRVVFNLAVGTYNGVYAERI